MKTLIRRSLTLAGVAVLAAAALAWAGGWGHGYGMYGYGHGYGMMAGYGSGYGYGYGMMDDDWTGAAANLTAEQRTAFEKLRQGHLERMAALRLEGAQLENRLAAAPDEAGAAQARTGLADLADRMGREQAEFRTQVAGQFGITPAVAVGPGRGMGAGLAACPGYSGRW
ncbi:MAG: hypothetical protein AB7D57_13880 [Desulfovibrionaceae bacterium]